MIDGAAVSSGQIVVVDIAIDELGKHEVGRSELPSPDGRSAFTTMSRPGLAKLVPERRGWIVVSAAPVAFRVMFNVGSW